VTAARGRPWGRDRCCPRESGVLGFVAVVAVFAAGMLLIVGFALIQVQIFPWIATMNVSNKVLNERPAVFTVFFAVVSAIVSLGGVLFGVATIRARIFSHQLGVGRIILTAASFVLGFLSIPGVGVSLCLGGGQQPGPSV
jgi:hypothetical protein